MSTREADGVVVCSDLKAEDRKSSRPTRSTLLAEIEAGSIREYWRAFNAAHADAYRSRSSSDPALAEHYAALAHVGFGYARALRAGDWSKTSIRPLSHFIPSTQKDKAA